MNRTAVAVSLLVLSYHGSRDNKPPDGADAKVDRGVVFSVEWTK